MAKRAVARKVDEAATEVRVMVETLAEKEDCASDYFRKSGAEKVMEPMDQFYGDRSEGVLDLFGNQWWFGTRNEEISSEELAKRLTKWLTGRLAAAVY